MHISYFKCRNPEVISLGCSYTSPQDVNATVKLLLGDKFRSYCSRPLLWISPWILWPASPWCSFQVVLSCESWVSNRSACFLRMHPLPSPFCQSLGHQLWLSYFYALPMHLECRRQESWGQGTQGKFEKILATAREVPIDVCMQYSCMGELLQIRGLIYTCKIALSDWGCSLFCLALLKKSSTAACFWQILFFKAMSRKCCFTNQLGLLLETEQLSPTHHLSPQAYCWLHFSNLLACAKGVYNAIPLHSCFCSREAVQALFYIARFQPDQGVLLWTLKIWLPLTTLYLNHS